MESLDVKIEDEDKAIILVVPLPSSYKHFKKILLYSNNDTLSFEHVKASLLSKEKFDLDVHSNDRGEGLNVRGRSFEKEGSNKRNTRSKSRGRKTNKICRYCKKKGHIIADCYSSKNKKEREEKNKDPPKLTTSLVELESDGDVLCVTTNENNCAVEWVLDSGCTFHMCPHRDWFSSYEPPNSGVVLIGNDAQCNVVGVRTIQIKTHDGVVRTLTNVRHVLNLKRNLISLGTLESNGCKYFVEGGVLKVSKGALVLMKGTRRGSLYILQGSTVTSSVVVTSVPSNVDLTKLWHARLGHMSEKGMTILSKRGLLGSEGASTLEFCEHCVFGKQK